MALAFRSVCVNCGSNPGAHPEYIAASHELGVVLAERGIRLIYGGSNVGLMGEVADATLAGGGEVVGVITDELNRKVGHAGLGKLHVVASMHERKTKMFELADAFVVLPGGFGTMEEAMELLTWAQLGLHSKPIGFLNVKGYFGHLIRFLDHAVQERFLKKEHLGMLVVAGRPIQLLADMEAYSPVKSEKWFER